MGCESDHMCECIISTTAFDGFINVFGMSLGTIQIIASCLIVAYIDHYNRGNKKRATTPENEVRGAFARVNEACDL
jgi:hypothetical protein